MPRPIFSGAIVIIIFALTLNTQIRPQTQVIIGDDTFTVLIAETELEQSKGLMGVPQLGNDNGMLFKFNTLVPRSFWMKNTLIPLDIIFIDENLKIVKIHKNVQPCNRINPKQNNCPSYNSQNIPVKYVLEIKANESQNRNINVGDYIKITEN